MPHNNLHCLVRILEIFVGLALAYANLTPQVKVGIPSQAETDLYASARTVVDLSREELLGLYPTEMQDVKYGEDAAPLGPVLEKAGKKVEAFFHEFPNTVCKEQVRMERLSSDGRVLATTSHNYLYSFSVARSGTYWEENRTESNGKPVDMASIPGFFLATGWAGMTAFLHPLHSTHCRFRYLGHQASDAGIHIIAFAQKPEAGAYLGSYESPVLPTIALILYQGFVWVDSRTYEIVRMRTDLLAPRGDVGLFRQTSEIWFDEVRFQSVSTTFWLPREVRITTVALSNTYRNRYRYSDYQVFTVTVQEKINPPVKK